VNDHEESACGGKERAGGMGSWWEERSLTQKILLGICFGILGMALFSLLGWVVMLLWNWLMPEIFGLKRLNYWQAWGLFALCSILFKGMGSSDSSRKSDRKRKKELRRYMSGEACADGKAPTGPSSAEGDPREPAAGA
jgi:hypothetical protein